MQGQQAQERRQGSPSHLGLRPGPTTEKGFYAPGSGAAPVSAHRGGTRRRHPQPGQHPGTCGRGAGLRKSQPLQATAQMLTAGSASRTTGSGSSPEACLETSNLQSQGETGGPRGRQWVPGAAAPVPSDHSHTVLAALPTGEPPAAGNPQQRQVPRSLTRFLHAADGHV